MPMMTITHEITTVIIIPCYNEEKRLPGDVLLNFLDNTSDIAVLLINDGSLDNTAEFIDGLSRKRPDKIGTHHLSRNKGKGEAVRVGLLKAFTGEPMFVGYWDADFSTSLDEIFHLREVLIENRDLSLVTGARVKMVGRKIIRKAWRHYSGRFIATLISIILKLPVYDTQCGAKIFRASPGLKELLSEPFLTCWLFDVEIIARLLLSSARSGKTCPGFYEEPLKEWSDVGGSNIGPQDLPLITKELWRLWRGYAQKIRNECQNNE